MANRLPDRAQVVIVGGGIIGCSVAYHLAKLGWKDVVLLERSKLTSGSTWHAAGLVTQLRSSRTLIEIAKYGVELYPKLEAETGEATGFRQTGSITVARTEGRMDELKKYCLNDVKITKDVYDFGCKKDHIFFISNRDWKKYKVLIDWKDIGSQKPEASFPTTLF